jgi:hypothetical protein
VRQRTVAYLVTELIRESRETRLKILGLSDHPLLAKYLKSLPGVDYINTFFDEEPMLNIEDPSIEFLGTIDILISSDVLEHVMFPISKTLLGSMRLLRRGGAMILTVPYEREGPSIEHYPWMTDYEVDLDVVPARVTGFNHRGEKIVLPNPFFHGGPGRTLEMRRLSLPVVIDEMQRAGFMRIRHFYQYIPDRGIVPAEKMGAIVGFRDSGTGGK